MLKSLRVMIRGDSALERIRQSFTVVNSTT